MATPKQIVLTTSWAQYTVQAALTTGASNVAVLNIGYRPNTFNGSMSFDAAWPTLN